MLHTAQTAMPRLMLVDDNPDILESTSHLLSIFGAEVRTFTSGADAISDLEDWLPDFVLTDVDMPGMGGLELMERVHANDRFAALPFIAITGNAVIGMESKLMDAGFALYLLKPNYLERLFDFIGMPSKLPRTH